MKMARGKVKARVRVRSTQRGDVCSPETSESLSIHCLLYHPNVVSCLVSFLVVNIGNEIVYS